MSIDWNAFTPWPALAGGALIGLAALMLMLLNGLALDAGYGKAVVFVLAMRAGMALFELLERRYQRAATAVTSG